eukprot:m51a1_g5512 putative udp-n-acetylglucosamine--dolichyl-phosphate n-acetylglucosaminephosphotransferase-like (380) ;mRNA; r:390117-391405
MLTRKLVFGSIVLALAAALSSLRPRGVSTLRPDFVVLAAISVAGYITTVVVIPGVMPKCLARRLGGRDLNKTTDALVPESLGVVAGTVYIICAVLFQPLFANGAQGGGAAGDYYEAGLLSVALMLMLGFADDVLDLRWRHKILLSAVATLPVLAAYGGPTDVALPLGLGVVGLGYLYHVAMALIVIFCTNSINIYAGINGLEVGQSVVISVAIAVCNAAEIAAGHDAARAHTVSLFLIAPFTATSLALLAFNWYPSAVFVGDSYTYFAGMTIAVAGILGHFTKTLLLLFVPQLFNFALSIPQLIGIVPCPRHRLPRLNKDTGKLEAVWPAHLNLVNFALRVLGPTRESDLVVILLLLQAVCCAGALGLRYYVLPHLLQG